MSLISVEGLGANAGKMNEPIPVGKYKFRVDLVEETQSKSGKPMLKLKHVVAEGDHMGRVLFDNLVLPNDQQSADANQLATSRVKRFLNALGIVVENDGFNTDDIMGKEFIGVVAIKSDKDYPEPRNELKDCLPVA